MENEPAADEESNQPAEAHPEDDPTGKPTIDEPTGPALDPGPDEFDKQDPETG
jgi:hypothetical protein